jgi:pyridinium-3,5-bisthiocarboxylic acid mononucleotide nickel chelatase
MSSRFMAEERHIHLDAVGGIAGDMFVAAMLDALPELRARVLVDVAAVLPPEVGEPRLEAGKSGGLSVLRFGLPGGGHATGHFAELAERIGTAPLAEDTGGHALAILRILAEAEGRLHGVPVEKVHFHEIADWDSVMDVVAAGSIAAVLEGARWSVSDLPLGGGLVRTQHGLLPVPAPATAAILEGFRWRDDGIGGERVTPTGAAILRHLVTDPGDWESGGKLAATGMGAGTRTLPGLPNILRALVFSTATAEAGECVVVLSFDIDDMTGEEIGVALDRLRDCDGVLDVSLGTRAGKKGRPLHDVRLLLMPVALDDVKEVCFRETSTIGLRWRLERRTCLARRSEERAVDGRRFRIKQVERPGGVTAKAESDDLCAVEGLAERRRLKARAEVGEEAS